MIEEDELFAISRMDELKDYLNRLEEKHPYKVPGDYDTYNEYSRGYHDCLSKIKTFIKAQADYRDAMNDPVPICSDPSHPDIYQHMEEADERLYNQFEEAIKI